METKAVLRQLRVAPRKVRLLIGLIRGMNAQEAIAQLRFSKKHAAVPVRKLLESAMANAVHNHSMYPDSLRVKAAFVDEGRTLKRWKPRAFGRASMIRKKNSHVTIILEGDVDEVAAKQKALAQAAQKQAKDDADVVDTEEVKEAKDVKTKTKKVKKENKKPAPSTASKAKKTVSRSAGRGR